MKFKQNLKLSPLFAILILLIVTVAASGAAFYWLSSAQAKVEGKAYESVGFERIATRINAKAADYENNLLTIFFENVGDLNIPVKTGKTIPTTTWILRDSNLDVVCSSDWSGENSVNCIEGCEETIQPGDVHKVVLDLKSTKCDISKYPPQNLFTFTVDFSTRCITTGSFVN